MWKALFPDDPFFVFFKAYDFHHLSSLISYLTFTSSLSSSSLSFRGLIFSSLSPFSVVVVSCSVLCYRCCCCCVCCCIAAAGCCCCCYRWLLVARHLFRYFQVCSLSLMPLLSSCQVHTSARRVACMRDAFNALESIKTTSSLLFHLPFSLFLFLFLSLSLSLSLFFWTRNARPRTGSRQNTTALPWGKLS